MKSYEQASTACVPWQDADVRDQPFPCEQDLKITCSVCRGLWEGSAHAADPVDLHAVQQ